MRRAFLVALLFLLAAPAVARAATVTSVVLYSDPTDSIGRGVQRLYTPANALIDLSTTASGVSAHIQGKSDNLDFVLSFGSQDGGPLTTGVQGDPDTSAIYITGNGTGCNYNPGRFEVKDVARDASGDVNRLWIVFEQHCQGNPSALFGEVRVNEPVADGPATIAPATVRWAPRENGGTGTEVPVTLLARSGVHISSATLAGANPGDFHVRDTCAGKSLSAGGSCQTFVSYTPGGPGTRTATLDLVDSGGHHYATRLEAFSYGGTTKAVVHSDPGDYVGGGGDAAFAPATDKIVSSGTPRQVYYGIDDAEWNGHFAAPKGQALTPGTTYTDAKQYPFNGDAQGMSVDGGSRSCGHSTGQFTVTDLAFDPHGNVKRFGVQFVQYCDGSSAGLHGEFDFRVGDDVPLAPWMSDGSPPQQPGDGSGTGGGDGGAGGGGGGGTPQPGTGPDALIGLVTLKPKPANIAFGHASRLRGSVTFGGGETRPGLPVELQASPFPYAGYVTVAKSSTDAKGGFAFKVKPDRNTRYRVLTDVGNSKVRTVFVSPASKARRTALGGSRYRVTFNLLGPLDLPYAGRPVFFYKVRGHTARRVARRRMRGLGHGRFRVSAILHLRSRRQHVVACSRESTPDAWGRPAAIDKVCGAPRLAGSF